MTDQGKNKNGQGTEQSKKNILIKLLQTNRCTPLLFFVVLQREELGTSMAPDAGSDHRNVLI